MSGSRPQSSAHRPPPSDPLRLLTTCYFPSPTYTDVPDAEHELWHPHYLHAIKAALDRL